MRKAIPRTAIEYFHINLPRTLSMIGMLIRLPPWTVLLSLGRADWREDLAQIDEGDEFAAHVQLTGHELGLRLVRERERRLDGLRAHFHDVADRVDEQRGARALVDTIGDIVEVPA